MPGANVASKALCEEWGAKNKVEVEIDYVTSQGNKNLLTIAALSSPDPRACGTPIFVDPVSWPVGKTPRRMSQFTMIDNSGKNASIAIPLHGT